MSGEYVRRSDALQAVGDIHPLDYNGQGIVERIKAIPAADVVEVRHGRWINGRCSECGEHAPFWAMAATYHLSKYCHGCGAKMDGGTDDV